MCALYDGAVVAAVSTLCWLAKTLLAVSSAHVWRCYGTVKPMQAVFVSLLPCASSRPPRALLTP